MKHRISALDWLRGIAVVVMVTDHASAAFNGGRFIADGAFFYNPEQGLPDAQFWYRWISHICAPAFVFLAGTALALSVERRRARRMPERRIDRDMAIRGLIIVALELFFINLFWLPGFVLLQVLYAIGVSMLLMIPLRRLPMTWLFLGACAVLAAGELVLANAAGVSEPARTILGFTLVGGFHHGAVVAYPVMYWLALMALGWVLGVHLAHPRSQGDDTAEDGGRSTARLLAIIGVLCLVLFAVLRAANSYGNMLLFRYGDSLAQWMHVSKYPPSLTFVGLEFGLVALMLALCFVVQGRVGDRVRRNNPLLVFGQTALFFYLAHILLLELSAHALSTHQQAGLGASVIASLAAIVVLYPACLWYRRYKASHPKSWVRYI